MTNEEARAFLQSRIDLIDKCYPQVEDYKEALDLAIKALEQQKAGKWEYVQYDGNHNIGNWHCSECRGICIGMHSLEDAYDYCPNCGAKMEVQDADSD